VAGAQALRRYSTVWCAVLNGNRHISFLQSCVFSNKPCRLSTKRLNYFSLLFKYVFLCVFVVVRRSRTVKLRGRFFFCLLSLEITGNNSPTYRTLQFTSATSGVVHVHLSSFFTSSSLDNFKLRLCVCELSYDLPSANIYPNDSEAHD
jgi:hypothetical protein